MLTRVRQLEQVLESMKDAVVRVDDNLYVSIMNDAAIKLFKTKEWKNRHLAEITKVPLFVEFL